MASSAGWRVAAVSARPASSWVGWRGVCTSRRAIATPAAVAQRAPYSTATGAPAPVRAIIGGGLGGLVLASVLHRHGVEVAVYDMDASPTARSQGGMLDMHEESGQAALRAAGVYEEFRKAVLPGGEAMRIFDKHGTMRYCEEDDGDRARPEVSRRALRDMLLATLPSGMVRWGAKVVGVRALGGGRHEVTLASNETFETDLLVGADGAWSRVRSLVSSAKPSYSGVCFVEVQLHDADRRHPRGAALLGSGSMMALGEEKGFLGHRDSDGSLHIYVGFRAPADWSTQVAATDTDELKAQLLDMFTGWDAALRAMIADADGKLVCRPIHALPIDHSWVRTPGVTLLGDAAHLMSPFAGEGANLAMQDGAELAAALVAHPEDTEAALAVYEAAMFPRSEAAAAESAANLEICFRQDAPQGMLDFFAQFAKPA